MGETGGIDAIILLQIQAIFILFPCIKPELINISHSPKAGMLACATWYSIALQPHELSSR